MVYVKLGIYVRWWYYKPTSGYKTKTIYVYYIVIEIFVFVYTNIFSPFYFLCVIIMPHHSPTIYFTQS
jgi:hypothetical protein